MAKICKQCGVKYRNNATKCIMCGTEFEDSHSYAKKKVFLGIGIAAVVLTAAIIIFVLLTTGPKAAVRKIMDCYKRNEVDTIVATFPDFLMESQNFNSDVFVSDLSTSAKEMSDYMISYNIEKANIPSSSDREETMNEILFFAGDNFDENDIQDVRVVWVNYKGNVSGIMQSNASRFTMIKYRGKWYWWPNNVNR